MKKILVFLLVITMLLAAGCGNQQPEPTEVTVPETTVSVTEAPTEAPTEPPTEPKPTCVNAQVQVKGVPAVLSILNRGDLVEVVGEYEGSYYVVQVDSLYGFVEKQLLRLETEEAYESWTGYAKNKAGFYDNYRLQGEAVQTLKTNTEIQVLDELDYCYVVQLEESIGFISKEQVSKKRITYGGGGDYSGGGGGGSSSGGGQDGGDITLRYGIVTLSATEGQTVVTGQAQVLADGTQFVLGLYNIGDTVSVVTEEGFAPAWDGHYTLYVDGLYAYLPKSFVLLEGEEPFAQWEGYCAKKAVIYDNYLMQGEGKTLKVNTEITVLWDGGDFYLVSTGDELGYLPITQVSATRYSTGGGYYDGGSSGGGGYVEEWSPPVL